jgi:L-methionine (R)-S-oxide reductase
MPAHPPARYADTLTRLSALVAGGTDEIVVPVFDRARHVRAVLDIDSDTPDAFEAKDAQTLEEICSWITPL